MKFHKVLQICLKTKYYKLEAFLPFFGIDCPMAMVFYLSKRYKNILKWYILLLRKVRCLCNIGTRLPF